MDVSLDAYMMRRKGAKGSVTNRLGVKKSPIVKKIAKQQPSFKITGVGKGKGFDARQKLGWKPVADARSKITQKKKFIAQKISAPGAHDARSKITQKTKFVDARVRIENKKANSGQDLRVKVNNLHAKNTDARTKINIKRQTKITVTGLGSVKPNFQRGVQAARNGGLTKTVHTGPIRNTSGSSNKFNKGVRVSGDSLVITRNSRPETTDINSLPGNARAPIIKIKNDYYKPPPASKQIPVRTTSRTDQSVFSKAIAETLVQHQQPKQPEPVYVQEQPTYHPPPQPQPTVVQYQYVPVIEPTYTQAYMAEPTQRHAYINPEFSNRVGDRLGQKVATPPKKVSSAVSQYKVMITNLHHIVSQDDIVELFGAVGALKRARILKAGTAEVIYYNKEDAAQACRKYHNRELDGQPMQVKVQLTSQTAPRKPPPVRKSPSPPVERVSPPPPAPRRPPPRRSPSPQRQQSRESEKEETMETEFEPLRLGKDAPPTKLANVDMGMIHKALFKVKGAGPTKPVTFTVKI